MSDLDEVGVADDFVDGAHLEHDEVVGAPSQTLRHACPSLDQLRPQDVEDGFEHELDKGDPIALVDKLIDAVDARGNEVALVGRGAAFERARDVVGFHERQRLLVDVAWEELVAV